jgi:hypothetical protein
VLNINLIIGSMKQILCILFSLTLLTSVNSQNLDNFKLIPVNKKVNEYKDEFSLSSVNNAIVTYKYIEAYGRNNQYSKLCVKRNIALWPAVDSQDSYMSEAETNNILNQIIVETIIYKDSIACAIVQIQPNSFSLRWYELENQMWFTSGEDILNTAEQSRNLFYKYAELQLNNLRREIEISTIPTDTLSFLTYLQNNGSNPIEFVTDALRTHKLVLYGEIHRRKISWDFLTSLIQNDLFPEYTGIIFMEMASNKQNEINRFLEDETINTEILLNIFRDYMIMGWSDKGMFDFVIAIWNLNKTLPDSKKIRVIAVDTPREFTKEGLENEIQNRDEFMANTIMNYLETTDVKRNALFIVGSAHVCKTMESAGHILTEKLASDVFTIFTHSPRVDNYRIIKERIRHGMFDYVFSKNGDLPVGFLLENSPFGQETFDGLYLDGSGTYQDNYDGYLFLGNLDKEPNGEVLYELYDDNFIKEIDRRYKLIGRDFTKEWELESLSSKALIDKIVSQQTKNRWEEYLSE